VLHRQSLCAGGFYQLGPVPTNGNSHLLVDFTPLFAGISLLASWQGEK